MTKKHNGFWPLLATMFFLTSCGGKRLTQALFQQKTPYQTYVKSLEAANLHQSALGGTWLLAGEKALQDSLLVKLPYQETGYFIAAKPAAASIAFQVRQGEIIDVQVKTRTQQRIKIFLDLFEISNGKPRTTTHIATADTTGRRLTYRAESNVSYLLRLQPELLSSGSYNISIVTKPSLEFPVAGKDSRVVQSFWGADRDNGSRRHEGVDIFAAKGTPAVASSKGIVSRVTETPIGGKVVWLTDMNNRQSLYYAHLDRQLVQPGQQVNPGDTLGLIGNTGNARTTPPHLHFGIYSFGQGAVDPFPFIHKTDLQPGPIKVNGNLAGDWGRIARNNAEVRISPEGKAKTVAKLPKNTAVQVLAGTSNWYKIQLPNGKAGYLYKANLESTIKPLLTKTLQTEAEVIEHPEITAALVAALKKQAKIAVLGFFQAYQLVKLADGTLGWILKS